jgi:hypothetical protein
MGTTSLKVVNQALPDRHANVVAASSAVQSGDLLAFAMGYVEGNGLAKLVKIDYRMIRSGKEPLPGRMRLPCSPCRGLFSSLACGEDLSAAKRPKLPGWGRGRPCRCRSHRATKL